MRDVVEAVGFLCLVAFAYLLFPPAALATAGVLLIAYANLSARRTGDDTARADDDKGR